MMKRELTIAQRTLSDDLSRTGTSQRRFIAVSGGKGGVGKSTVAVNLAAFHGLRSKTLLFDGDLGMADLNLLLGLAPSRSILDVLLGQDVGEAIVSAHGIHLLPGLNGSHQLANLDAFARQRLISVINSIRESFETLIVDTAAGIEDSTTALTAAASDIVVVTNPEPLALADAYACLKVLANRHGVTRAFLIPNAVKSPAEADQITAQLSALVNRFLGIEVVPLPPIAHDPSVAAAAAAGVPLVLWRPDSPASRGIANVARSLDAFTMRPHFEAHEEGGHV